MRRSVLTSMLVIALILTACAAATGSDPAASGASPAVAETSTTGAKLSNTPPSDVQVLAASLTQAASCDELLAAYQDRALEIVGPYGIGGGDYYGGPWMEAAATEGTTAAAGDTEAGGDTGYTTNVQVEGVDEADTVKSDGQYIYSLMDGNRLRIWEITDDGLERRGSLRFDRDSAPHSMLMSGDTLVLIGTRWQAPMEGERSDTVWGFGGSQLTELIEVDISDRSDPTETRRIVFDGSTVSTRLVDNSLRLILQSGPVGVEWAHPSGAGLRAERTATERNREIVRETTIDNWLPYAVVTGDDGEEEGVMLDCEDVLVPADNDGVDTLSILEFDVGSGIDSWAGGGVIATGETVYATAERIYVATGRWQDPRIINSGDGEPRSATSIHRFDTPADGEPVYVASGEVPGYLLNQFAMDEFEGDLRVASTDTPEWWGDSGDSESHVTVLRTEGDELVEIGSVGDLGVTEQIYAVRFMGDMGYVVTFRQVDPLYTLDLSDPTSPEVLGELKIPGYSSYLHPLDDGRLLGIGQNASNEGMTTGLQASLFDVSDPADPTRLDTSELKDAYSPVEYDHKAFTSTGDAAFIPYERWTFDEENGTESNSFGIMVIPLDGSDLSDTRRIPIFDGKSTEMDRQWGYSPQRSLVIDNTAYALGYDGISVIDLDSGEVIDQVR